MIYRHAPQRGRSLEEKLSFSEEVNCEWDTHSAHDLVMLLGDINGHVGRHIDGLGAVHGGYDVGQRNSKGKMLLQFCLEKELCVKYIV